MSLEPDKSAFLEFLEYLGRPGQVVKNTLGGRGESALRHYGQMGLDGIDAFLPGDWLPNDVARPEDDLSGRELIGADDDFMGNVAGFGIDMLTDPLTYVPGAVFAKGAKGLGSLAKTGASKVVGPEAVDAGLRHMRSTFAATKLPEPIRKVVDGARGGKLESSAALMASKKALQGLDDRQLNIVGDAIDNFKWEDGKLAGELVGTSMDPVMGKRSGSLLDRIMSHPELAPGEAERLAKAAEELTGVGRSMKGRKGIFSPRDQANLSDEYLMRSYEGLPENELLEMTASAAKPTKERSLEGYREVQGFLAKPGNEAVKYERNALKRALSRGTNQGELAKRADLGQGLFGLLRSGGLNLPDELIEESARGIANVRGPVPASGASADVSRMLGGDVTGAPMSGLVGDISGISTPPVTPTIEETVADIYGIGNQSGKSAVGPSLVPEGPAESINSVYGSFSGKAMPPGETILEAGDLPDIYGLGSISGKSRPPATPTIEPSDLDLYGIGSFSGRAKPPTTPKIDPTKRDLYGVGDQSGKAVAPKTGAIEESNKSLVGYGVGEQSGKSVVGERTAQTFSKPSAEQMAKGREKLLADDFAYSNPEHRKIVNAAIAEVGKTDKEAAKFLDDAMNGMPARGWLTSLMAKSNSVFKPFATAGYIIPKLGFSVRNRLSGAWSAASNPEARGVAAKNVLRIPGDIAGAIADGLGLKTGDRLGKAVSAWDDALANSGGSAGKALELLEKAGHKDAAALIRSGGLDGFVRSEELLKELTSNGTMAKLHRMAKWPAKIAKGMEDRMRLGLGMDLIDAGKSSDEAAKIVRDTLFDYDVSSASNRTFRDFVPFGQFMAKAVPQQAKFMAEKPWLAAGIGHALDQDVNEPTPPWMDGKIAIPLGDHQFLTGLGLPFEALNSIPNPSASLRSFGRDIEKNLIGSSQPVAKTAFAAVSGEDPYFESPFGSYDRMPLIGKAGEVGRMYNIAAATGLGAAIEAPLKTIDKAFDDRKSPLLRAADLLTGANVTTVDPDMALQQRLSQALKNNPDIRQITTPINMGGGEDLDQMLQELRDVKARLKAKREKEAARATSVL